MILTFRYEQSFPNSLFNIIQLQRYIFFPIFSRNPPNTKVYFCTDEEKQASD